MPTRYAFRFNTAQSVYYSDRLCRNWTLPVFLEPSWIPAAPSIPNAAIVVENQSTGARSDLTTNAEGTFVAPVLPIGTYRITASASGFRSQVLENNRLQVSDRLHIEITLQPGAVGEKITVTADAPLVEASSTTLGGLISSNQISAPAAERPRADAIVSRDSRREYAWWFHSAKCQRFQHISRRGRSAIPAGRCGCKPCGFRHP